MILCTKSTKILQGEEAMMKKYIPAEIEMILAGTCDVIAMSLEIPENPEGGGTGGETPGGSTGGSGVGNNYNQDGWIGI